MPIPFSDLEAEHRPLKGALNAAAQRVLESNRFVLGAEVAAFESEISAFLRIEHAVGVSSGTDGILAILMACGVGPGHEVITTPFTFFATAGAILRLGATPVFADIDDRTLNIDADDARSRIGPRTRAILAVHLFGRPAHLAPLVDACASDGIHLLEDAAQAMGARSLAAESSGAVLSFHPSKNLGGFGDGGMVVTRDVRIADRLRVLRVHGATERFHHAIVGGNFRLDELQAALLRVKVPHLAEANERRRRIAGLYHESLADLPLALPPPDDGAVWSQFVVRVPNGSRDALAGHLAELGVATAVYYPTPLHLQPALAALGGRLGQYPRAEQAAREVLALPIYPTLSPDQIGYVSESIRSFFRLGARP